MGIAWRLMCISSFDDEGCAADASDKSRTDDPVNGLSLRLCMYEGSSEELRRWRSSWCPICDNE